MAVRAAHSPASPPEPRPTPAQLDGAWEVLAVPRPFVVAPRTPDSAPATAPAPAPAPPPARPAPRRRPRLRIWASLVAAAILLAANLAMQASRGYWDTLADPYYVRQRVQQCESLGRVPDVLYLGSSRDLYTVNPARVDGTLAARQGSHTLGCNVGQFASTFEQDYYTLQRFLRDGYTPKLVVEVLWEWNLNANAAVPADSDPFHFNQVLQLAQAPDTPQILERMGGVPNGIPGALDFLAGQLLPLYGDRTALLQKLCNGSQVGPCGVYTSPMDPGLVHLYQTSTRQGWIGNGSAPLGKLPPDQQLARLDGLNPYLVGTLQNFAIGGHQPDWLARMIALAKAHGIRFVMLQTPLSPEYYQLFPHPDDWQRVTDYWASFAAAHGVPYYDESHLAGYSDADFVDLHHLQAAGADRFSAWLATNVVGPALATTP